MQIEIVNWEKYNPRKNLKSSSWFRLENNFCTRPDLFDLTNDEKMVWIYVMCEASRSQKSTVTVNAGLVGTLLRIDAAIVANAIEVFETKGLVTTHAVARTTRVRNKTTHARHTHDTRCRPTDERTPFETKDDADASKEADVDTSREAVASPPSPRDFAELWNTHSSTAQRKIDLKHFKSDSQRWRLAKARLAQEPDLTYWRKVIERIAASDFCNGDNNRGWVANFDFLVRKDTHMKTLEGTYSGAVETGFGKKMEDYFTPEERERFGVT